MAKTGRRKKPVEEEESKISGQELELLILAQKQKFEQLSKDLDELAKLRDELLVKATTILGDLPGLIAALRGEGEAKTEAKAPKKPRQPRGSKKPDRKEGEKSPVDIATEVLRENAAGLGLKDLTAAMIRKGYTTLNSRPPAAVYAVVNAQKTKFINENGKWKLRN